MIRVPLTRTARRAAAVAATAVAAAAACAVPAAAVPGPAGQAVDTLGTFVAPEAVDARTHDNGALSLDAPFLQR
ncbi:hypothetical protein AB0957_15445 [Streptomyces zhihengii]|uniref:hypothetical protein n=1 Tax=Streptomyces zhihengii TaxID=1818004 RepID=UPI0034541E5B